MIDTIPNADTITEEDVILVTGGSGLYGYAVNKVREKLGLKGKWIFLSSKDADLRKLEDCRKVFELHKPTYVLHLAAFVGGLFKNMKYKVQFWNDNVNLNNNVLSLCNEYKVKKVVSCLSTCVFPDQVKYPILEKDLHNGPPHFSNNAYAYSKRMLDMLGRWYNEQESGKIRFTSVIPTNLFGPNDYYNIEDGHVLPGLMHKCYLSQKNGTDFVVYGSGKPLRQFLYSIDAAELLIWTLLNYHEEEPIIISVDEKDEISIGDAARLVAEAFEFKGNMAFDTSKADGQFKKTASNSKLKTLYPNYKFTPAKDAVKESVQWFIDNFETCRK